jgi:hypothetical protein
MVSFRVTAQRSEKLRRVALVFNNIPAIGMTVHPLAWAFVQGLRDLGLVEGRNIMIERRSAEGRYERLPSLMQELLALQVDVIVTTDRALGQRGGRPTRFRSWPWVRTDLIPREAAPRALHGRVGI